VTRIEGEITIDRPAAEVFDFVADERNEPLYNPRLTHVELLTPGPIGVGTRYRAETTAHGRAVPMTIELTDYARPHRLGSRTHLVAMDIMGQLTFEPAPEGTRMRWCWILAPRGALRLARPLLAWMGRRQERAIWASLKRLLESSPA
jgi:hypothetical protein